MAGFDVSALPDFTQKATELLQDAVLFTEDFKKYTLEQGVPYKKQVVYQTTETPIQDYDCDLTISGGTLFSYKELETKHLKYETSYCETDFENKGLENLDVVKSVMDSITKGLRRKVERSFWIGDSSNDGEFDGIIPQITADANVIDVTISAITNSNVDDAVDAVMDEFSLEILQEGTMVLHVSYKTFKLYRQWLMSNDNNYDMRNIGMKATATEVPLYGYVDAVMRVSTDIPDDTIIATYDKNIIVVQNNTSEKFDKARLVTDYIKPEKFYVLTDFHFGVNYKFGNHIVYAKV